MQLYSIYYLFQFEKERQNKLLPVMVWIPGGGFSSGHGGLSLYGPHYLLDKDIIMVSFNYRVGSFGKLRTMNFIINISQ